MNDFEKSYFMGGTSNYKLGYSKAINLMKKRLNSVLKNARGGKLLDVGCAYGFFLQDAEKYFEVYGFDISKYAIERAKKNTSAKLKIFSADQKWTYKKEFFDVITMWDVIEHVKDPKKIISEARGCVKHEGYIYIETPNKFIRNLIGDKDKTHINKHNFPYWFKLFKNEGLKLVEWHTEFPRFLGKKDYINKILKIFRLPLGTNLHFILKK